MSEKPTHTERNRGLIFFGSVFVIALIVVTLRLSAPDEPAPKPPAVTNSQLYTARQFEEADALIDAVCDGMPKETFSEACRSARSAMRSGIELDSCGCAELRCGGRPVSDAISLLDPQAREHPRYALWKSGLLEVEDQAIALCRVGNHSACQAFASEPENPSLEQR